MCAKETDWAMTLFLLDLNIARRRDDSFLAGLQGTGGEKIRVGENGGFPHAPGSW